jgi:hypothetical protein
MKKIEVENSMRLSTKKTIGEVCILFCLINVTRETQLATHARSS